MKLELYSPFFPIRKVKWKFNDPNYLGHNGLDFSAPIGTPIYATHDGMAQYQINPLGGHEIIIVSNEKFEMNTGTGYAKTIHSHMIDGRTDPQHASLFLKEFVAGTFKFQPVKRGQVIGYVGMTGNSTGPHLHFGLKRLKDLNQTDQSTYDMNNGYLGAIDPLPYLTDKFEQPINEMMPYITELQKFLIAKGYLIIPSTIPFGYFGELTQKAVEKYQIDHS